MANVQALLDIETWLSLTEAEQDAIVYNVAVALEAEFLYENTLTYISMNSMRVPSFRHILTGLEMNLVIGGTFTMGLSEREEKTAQKVAQLFGYDIDFDIEIMRPTHTVQVRPFLMTKFPILDEFARRYIELDENLFRPEFGDIDDIVPIYLSRDEIERLAGSLGFSLPSEAQWEYAYRSTSQTLFYFGDSLPNEEPLEAQILLCEYSDHQRNQKAANPFGFVGMCVGEWCEDSFTANYSTARDDDTPILKGRPYIVRGGAAALWPWQDYYEWTLCISAMRRSSEILEDDTCGARFVRRLKLEADSIEVA
jgi:formylglycine-generating enzyme required for sulfatase activity